MKHHLKVAVCTLFSVVLALAGTGCSESKTTVSDKKKKDVVTQINDDCGKDSSKGNKNFSLTGGNIIDVPDEFDDVQDNTAAWGGYYCLGYGGAGCYWAQEGKGWAAGEVYREWLNNQGMAHEPCGLNLIDGRVGVVCKPIYGEGGDYVDVVYKDGNVLHGIILDHKSTENEGQGIAWEKYGHGGNAGACTSGCNVLEWYVYEKDVGSCYNTTLFKDRKNDPKYGFIFGTVDYFVNYGNRKDGVAESSETTTTTTPSDAAATGTSSSSITTSNSSLKVTTHNIWSAGRSDPHTDPVGDFPADAYINNGTHDGDDDTASPEINTSMNYDSDYGHGEMTDVKYIVLHDTENGSSQSVKDVADYLAGTSDKLGIHFLVDRDGTIYQTCDTKLACYHAGSGGSTYADQFSDIPDGAMNKHSIGIEIMHVTGTTDYPEEQLDAVDNLIAYLRGGATKRSNTQSNAEQCKDKGSGGTTSSMVPAEADKIHFKQWEYEDSCYGGNATIKSAGCGICAMTCCIDILLNQSYTPPDVVKKMEESGKTYYSGGQACGLTCTAVAEVYGLKTESLSSINDVKQALTSGACVWMGGEGPYKGDDGTLTSHGHCVMFYKIANGEYYCHDSGINSEYTVYSEEEITKCIESAQSKSGCYKVYK